MKNKHPKISIVTPSFNQGQFIEETICSVLDQGYDNLEYIIIDGGSKDETIDIIKKYQKHLTFWESKPDKGQSDALNKGLNYCTGEIFNWLNSDDLLAAGSLSVIAKEFESPQIEIVSGQEIYFEGTNEEQRYGSIIFPELEQNLIHGVIYQPSTFWRMSALKPLLPINEDFHYLMDTLLWVKYIYSNGISGIRKIENTLAKFRLHESSKTVGLPDEFVRERWKLRYQLLKELDPELLWLDDFISLKTDIFTEQSWPSQRTEIEIKRILTLMVEELCYEFYRDFEYKNARRAVNLGFKHAAFSYKLFNYFVKLNLVPTSLLNRLRYGQS